MAYMKETCICGRVMEVRKYHDWGHGRRNRVRGARRAKTKEAVAKNNERNAVIRLRRKLNAGCEPGDYHITCTYENAPTAEEAKNFLRLFLDKGRRLYKRGGYVFRWLAVTEYQAKRIHHHIILKQGPELKEILKLWEHGRPKVTLLDESGQYGDLAKYLVKETSRTFRDADAILKKRWSCSRNWPEPIITKEVVSAEHWRETPKDRKGWFVIPDSVVSFVDDGGFGNQFYMMRRLC